jgi:hypothetical protein
MVSKEAEFYADLKKKCAEVSILVKGTTIFTEKLIF